ncbi:MAG: hypothetical protein WBG36_09680 [Ornithinimicrobium sp.]
MFKMTRLLMITGDRGGERDLHGVVRSYVWREPSYGLPCRCGGVDRGALTGQKREFDSWVVGWWAVVIKVVHVVTEVFQRRAIVRLLDGME